MLRMILIVIAVLGALKAVFALIRPALARRVVDWWLAVPAAMGRFVGIVLAVLGLLLVGLAVAKTGDTVIGAAVLIGALAIAAGIAYQYPRVWHGVLRPFSSSGSLWMLRMIAVIGLLLCGALLFIGLRSWPS